MYILRLVLMVNVGLRPQARWPSATLVLICKSTSVPVSRMAIQHDPPETSPGARAGHKCELSRPFELCRLLRLPIELLSPKA